MHSAKPTMRAKTRENTRISTIWGLSSLPFPLCVCVIPQTKWVGEVQAQFTEENILYSAQQAGLLSVKQNQQHDLSRGGGRHRAANPRPRRLNRAAVKGAPRTVPGGAAARTCAPQAPPRAHSHPPGARGRRNDFLVHCYFFSPAGQGSRLGLSLGRVITAETFPRKPAPACSLVLWR